MTPLFKVFKPSYNFGQKIDEILESGQLNSGEYLSKFEKRISDYIDNPFVLVVSNNNLASMIALALCQLRNDDEVIASPMSCLASNQPVLNFGAKIVWADIDPSTGTLSPDDVRKKISSKTKAIIHYHWCGFPGYIDEINSIGNEFGISVIDDGIESFGSEYKNRLVGNVGTPITTFSFQTVRLPHSIEGGAIVLANQSLYEKAKLMRDFGINRNTFRDSLGEISQFSDIKDLGYNATMNEINSYIGYSILKDTPNLISIQRENAKILDTHFNGLHLNRKEINPNFWVYSFLTNRQNDDLKFLRDNGYYASKVHIRNDYYSCFGKLDLTLKGINEFSVNQLSTPSGWWVDGFSI